MISGNSALGGGGISNYNQPYSYLYGSLNVTDSIISGNSSTYGGGIESYGNLYVDHTVIENNLAWRGAGIDTVGVKTKAVLSFSTVSGNSASGSGGGMYSNGYLTVSDSTFNGNSAGSSGGGAHIASGSTPNNGTVYTIAASTLTNNTAQTGGGVFNDASGNAMLEIINSTLTGNAATTKGGGIYSDAEGGVIDATIVGDTAGISGGGIYTVGNSFGISGSIVAGNTHGDLTASASVFSGTYNLIGDRTGGLSTASTDHNKLGTFSSPIDPLLATLSDHGGPTQTMALLPGSPALASGITYLTTDQRGFTRPRGSAYDIGAFQVQSVNIATAAHASPSPATGITTNLAVVGNANDGESRLNYTWATTGTPPAAVSFSANGTNAAKSTVATFSKAGTYNFTVTIADQQGFNTTSSVQVIVNQTLTSIIVTPNTATINDGRTQQFIASARDQFGTALITQPTFSWSIGTGNPGSINSSSGLYTAPNATNASITVRATSGTVSGISTLNTIDQPPTVATAASASPASTTGSATTLGALGADETGESNLTYAWSATVRPSGANSPVFVTNGANSSKTTIVTGLVPGSYTFLVTITNLGGLTVTSNVHVAVCPPTISPLVIPSATQGAAITITATAAPYQNNGDGLEYQWTLADGSGNSYTLPNGGITTTPSLTFTPNSIGNWTASLTVTDTSLGNSTKVSQGFAVTALIPLSIIGPHSIADGGTANFNLAGTATTNVSWSVSRGSTVFATGSGTTFSFTPSDSGQYIVQATGHDAGSVSHSMSVDLTVTDLAPTVTISGPPVGFSGKSMVFGSKIDQSLGIYNSVTYAWSVFNADGSNYEIPTSATDPTNLSTFVVPGSLAAGSYQLHLTVTAHQGDISSSATQVFDFTVMAAPNANNFDWGTAPMVAEGYNSTLLVDGMVRQDDGKIVIVGRDSSRGSRSFLARFNSDLSLDTSFGAQHTGIVQGIFADATPAEGWSDALTIAINPTNQDIVVGGEIAETSFLEWPVMALAEYLGQDTLTTGDEVLFAGTPDLNFNSGATKVLASSTTSTAAFRLAISPTDGSILVGGIVATRGTQDAQNAWASEFGDDEEPIHLDIAVSDFFLAKFTASGSLDLDFNETGIAEQPGVTQLPGYAPFNSDYPLGETSNLILGLGTSAPGIQSMIVLGDGKILVAGDVQRLIPGWDGSNGPPFETGFGLVQYNSDGTNDTTNFGTDGQTFVGSQAFNGTIEGVASVRSMEVIPGTGGGIVVAGLADAWNAIPPTGNAHVVFTKFDDNGILDDSYHSTGIFKTDIADILNFIGYGDAGGDGGEHVHTLLPADNTFAFDASDNDLTAVVTTGSTWQIVHVNTSDGSFNGSLGSGGQVNLPVPIAPPDEVVDSIAVNRPTSLLLTDDGTFAAGDWVTFDPRNSALNVPLVVRYRTIPEPAVSDLAVHAASNGPVTLTWTSTGYGAEGFQIRRATSSGNLDLSSALIGTVGPNQYDFVDNGVTLSTTFYYEVVPFSSNGSAEITASDIVPVQTFPAPVAPVLQIVSAVLGGPTIPVFYSATSLSVLAANADDTSPPWTLSLIWPSGQETVLAQSANFPGAVPGYPTVVASLDPAYYPNGTYTLRLSTTYASPAANFTTTMQVLLESVAKVGNFTLPVTDASLNSVTGPITVSRSYDSDRVGLTGDTIAGFGPGWTFGLLDTQLTSTARPDTFDPTQTTPVFRVGDLITLTVPNDGRHVFEFSPLPLHESDLYEGSLTGVEYTARFIAIDGSGATLTLSYFNVNATAVTPVLEYDPTDEEYIVVDQVVPNVASDVGFNPARDLANQFEPTALQYQLTTNDGTSYNIDSATGQINSVTDRNGNTTSYSSATGGTIVAKDQSGQVLLTIDVDGSHRITSIQAPGQNPVVYSYIDGNLASVQTPAGDKTLYSYQDASHPHYLTGITSGSLQLICISWYNFQPCQGGRMAVSEKVQVQLNEAQRRALRQIIKTGMHPSAMLRRAQILLKADIQGSDSWSDRQIGKIIGCSFMTVRRVRQQFAAEGLEATLHRKRPTGRQYHKLDGKQEARLVAVACSTAPEGRARWTMSLLSERLVEMKVVDSIDPATIWRTLKKTRSSPGSSSSGSFRPRPTRRS